jgi:hypothetical protein
MRKTVLLASLIVLVTAGYAQNPKNDSTKLDWEWAPVGAKWFYSVPELGSGNPFDSVLIYESTGDTIINSQTCKNISYGYNNNIFMYSDNQKVYYWKYDQFNIIFDFTLNQNDTVVLTPRVKILDTLYSTEIKDTILNLKLIVDSVSNISFGKETLKRFYLHYIDTVYPDIYPAGYVYTEKIGSKRDIIEQVLIELATLPEENSLRCYKDSTIDYMTSWWSYQGYPCDYETKVNLPNSDKYINIYPNPANEMLIINTEYECKLLIRNKIGYTTKVISLFKGNNKIDLSNFPSGLLILELRNKQMVKYYKIIKI